MRIEEDVWIIMSKDKKMIAKGVPRNRYLIPVDDLEDKKRILTYTSKKKAEAGFLKNGFYGMKDYSKDDLEAIQATFILQIK